ncbi:hypothetical protein D7V86_14095 [bacterium D16-51]|nr:hypothetical protein D7V96_11140 [bacterium D16-59]RKI59134.1 hypothetical protein D7V86_14095 [bacterium D16-51]
MYHYAFCAAEAYRTEISMESLFLVQTVVRVRAYAGSLKSKAILKELNCPAESNVCLNFCQIVIYKKLSLFCRKIKVFTFSYYIIRKYIQKENIFYLFLQFLIRLTKIVSIRVIF